MVSERHLRLYWHVTRYLDVDLAQRVLSVTYQYREIVGCALQSLRLEQVDAREYSRRA